MRSVQLKTFNKNFNYEGHYFFILNKGMNSGKPLKNACPNCFICLAATELGLGTCCVCNFNAELCHRQFGLPDPTEPIAIIPIGYPEDSLMFEQTAKKRKGLSEIVKWEKYC